MFKKLALLLAPLALLTACDNRQSSDGYEFGEPSMEVTFSAVEIITYDNYSDLKRAAIEKGVKKDETVGLEAFSEVVRAAPNGSLCKVHMIDPKVKYVPEFIGHEMTHCFYGQWHTSNKERS